MCECEFLYTSRRSALWVIYVNMLEKPLGFPIWPTRQQKRALAEKGNDLQPCAGETCLSLITNITIIMGKDHNVHVEDKYGPLFLRLIPFTLEKDH